MLDPVTTIKTRLYATRQRVAPVGQNEIASLDGEVPERLARSRAGDRCHLEMVATKRRGLDTIMHAPNTARFSRLFHMGGVEEPDVVALLPQDGRVTGNPDRGDATTPAVGMYEKDAGHALSAVHYYRMFFPRGAACVNG